MGVVVILVSLLAVVATPAVRAGYPPAFDWISQFGGGAEEHGFGVAVDATGAYVVGLVMYGGIPDGGGYIGDWDVYIRRVDTRGDPLWTRQFGTVGQEQGTRVAGDASGAYVVGWTSGTFPGESREWDGWDAYIRKYDPAGNAVWTDQWGSGAWEVATGVAVDATGVYVSGSSWRDSYTGYEAFVRKYDANGSLLWVREFTTADGMGPIDGAFGLGIAGDPSGVYVTGTTHDTFPGETSAGHMDVYVRKYSPDGEEIWTHQAGTPGLDVAYGVAVDATGAYAVGSTCVPISDYPTCTSPDALIYKFEPALEDASAGGEPSGVRDAWMHSFGTSRSDHGNAVTADATGVYVAGLTDGVFPDQPREGTGFDAFVRKYDAGGQELWTLQFGSPNGDPAYDNAEDIAAGASGVYVAGSTLGRLPGSPRPAGYGDAFLARWAPEPQIEPGAGPSVGKVLPPILPIRDPPSRASDTGPPAADGTEPGLPAATYRPSQPRRNLVP